MISLRGKVHQVSYELEKTRDNKEYVEEKIDVNIEPKGTVYIRIPQQSGVCLGDDVIITIKKVKSKEE